MPQVDRPTAARSARRLFIILACAIFAGETAVMLILDATPKLAGWQEAILDATCLSIIVAPALYFFVFRPLTLHIGERQQAEESLRERSELLAALSARMLDAQEIEKQRIAIELHERVAQTLAAAKLSVEQAALMLRNGNDGAPQILAAMIGPLQAATRDVRAVAVSLRPPSLDDLGLLAALRETCRSYGRERMENGIATSFAIADEDVPRSLQSIIFRVAESALKAIATEQHIGQVSLDLQGDPRSITLTIRRAMLESRPDDQAHPDAYGDARDRTVLSGGKFSAGFEPSGGITLTAIWLR
jgi:signal transduction histidine kinase